MKLPEMITIGESMVVFSPNVPGPLRYVPQLPNMWLAPSLMYVGLTRLGHSADLSEGW